MDRWQDGLRYDPVPVLINASEPAVAHFARRDLRGEAVSGVDAVWELPEVKRIIRRQLPSGTWPLKASARAGSNPAGHGLVEAYRNLRVLVDQYELDRRQQAVARAVEYVFSHQTGEGDIRGILANQYAPYYTGALLGLAVKAGYAEDPHVETGIQWLLSVRQDDGGWAPGSPGMAGLQRLSADEMRSLTSDPARETARAFDPARPSSAAATGMTIRALAAHPRWRRSGAAVVAGGFLKSKLLRKDNWASYRHAVNSSSGSP